MHDPMTVAFELRIPKVWRWLGKKSRNTFHRDYFTLFTIWHVDPETDGTDDSCGWFKPRLEPAHKAIIEDMLGWEKNFPFFSANHPSYVINPRYAHTSLPAGECFALITAAWGQFAFKLYQRSELTLKEIQLALTLACNPHDNLRALLTDTQQSKMTQAEDFLYCVMRHFLAIQRPWYKAPKWHVRHWKLQVPLLQAIKRKLFTRCSQCGKSFKFGAAVHSNSWHGTGPRWFKSEEDVYHSECGKTVKYGEAQCPSS